MQLKCIHLKGIIVLDLKENLGLDTKKQTSIYTRYKERQLLISHSWKIDKTKEKYKNFIVNQQIFRFLGAGILFSLTV